MQSVIRSIFVLCLLGIFTVAYAQLPPKVIADKYLVQAEQLLEKQDYEAALNILDKIIALQKEHNLTLPDEFHFQYAQATFFKYGQVPVPADSIRVALELVSKYLSAEMEGESYKEALALLLKIEEKLEESEELEFSPDRTCDRKGLNSSCWMVLANHPECYVWNPYLEQEQTMTWTGACSGGMAQGEGTLSGNYRWNQWYIVIFEATGHLQNGRRQGQWVYREQKVEEVNSQLDPSGWQVSEGPYVLDVKHGQWVTRTRSWVRKETYANGVLHGPGAFHWLVGKKGVSEGSYVNGSRHGRWVFRDSDGTVVRETTYVNGKEQ